MTNPMLTRALRVAAALGAALALAYALTIAVDLADVFTRPANADWVEVMMIFFMPVFLDVALLALAAWFLARYAWRGSFFGK